MSGVSRADSSALVQFSYVFPLQSFVMKASVKPGSYTIKDSSVRPGSYILVLDSKTVLCSVDLAWCN